MFRRAFVASACGAVASAAIFNSPEHLTWWCLALTVGQAFTHIACSRDHINGWTSALALQPPWATYCILTGQPSFLITTTMITVGNLLALRRLAAATRATDNAR